MNHTSKNNRRTATALLMSAVFLAGSVWRGLVAVRHYATSLTIDNDPSIRELEQVGALLEAGIAVLLLIHAVALLLISKHWFQFRGPFALGVAVLCGGVVSGALVQFSVFATPGVYPLAIVLGVVVLSWLAPFGWVSMYCGALVGSVIAWLVAAPVTDALACLFVVVPCLVYVFIGAGLSWGIAHLCGEKHAT